MTASGNGDEHPKESEHPTERNTPLEQAYRRLLRWYPHSHRAVYGEEMLGVLIAGTRPGQRRPGRKESASLLAGAAIIRLRRAAMWLTSQSWQDAFAVLSVVGPVLMLTLAVQNPYQLRMMWDTWPGWSLLNWSTWADFAQYSMGPVALACLAILLLAVAKWRRAAAGLATLTTVYIAYLALAGRSVPVSSGQGLTPVAALWIFTGTLTAVSLAFSAGPRRGLAVLGQLRTTALVLTAAITDVLTAGQALPHSAAFLHVIVSSAVPIRYAALLVAAILISREPAGRRVLALTAPVAVLVCLEKLGRVQTNGLISCLYLGLAVIVVMLAVAAWHGARVTRPFTTAVS
jgi:hypothetical protein